jgi:hypothetical protein
MYIKVLGHTRGLEPQDKGQTQFGSSKIHLYVTVCVPHTHIKIGPHPSQIVRPTAHHALPQVHLWEDHPPSSRTKSSHKVACALWSCRQAHMLHSALYTGGRRH